MVEIYALSNRFAPNNTDYIYSYDDRERPRSGLTFCRPEFHTGTYEGRILGDEKFSEKALALAEEKRKNRWTLIQIIHAVCLSYGIEQKTLFEPGKKQPGAEARAIVAYLVQEEEHLSLTDLGDLIGRDLAALSRAAGRIRERIRENFELVDKISFSREKLLRISKCQA